MTSSNQNPEPLLRPLPEVYLNTGERTNILSDRVSPGGSFYPVGFSLEEPMAENLIIHDIKVGANSQFASAGSVPGSLFSSDRYPHEIRLDPAAQGQRICLSVTNTGPSGVFKGSAIGSLQQAKDLPRVLGFGHTDVLGHLAISVQPQASLEPCQLHVSPLLLELFEILAVHGERYLDIDEIPLVPPHMLTSDSLLRGGKITFLHSPIVGDGTSIVMRVSNKTSKSQVFSAALLCK